MKYVLRPRASVLAIHFALLAFASASHAADATVDDLTKPTSTVSLGVVDANKNVAKAQEYSGLSGKSTQAAVDLDLAGGGAYDSDSATRWSLIGRDLGLGSPSLALDIGVQGSARLRLNHDELLRRKEDGFQTPYLGVGSSVFTLPSTWLVPKVNGSASAINTANTGRPATNARGLSQAVTDSNVLVATGSGTTGAITLGSPTGTGPTSVQTADLPLFNDYEIRTRRNSDSLAVDYQFGRNWSVAAKLGQEHRSGLKLINAMSGAGGDNSSTMPTLVDDDTSSAHLGATYVGSGLVFDFGYDGSAYSNHAKSISWTQWNDNSTVAAMSTAPSNDSHKVYASAGYTISPMFKLVGNVAYGRGNQNDPYNGKNDSNVLVPKTSDQQSVVTQQFGLKLIAKPIKDLSVIAGYKHDLRENRTPVSTFVFYDVGEIPPSPPTTPATTGPQSANLVRLGVPFATTNAINAFANRPYSKKVDTGSLEGDYQLNSNNRLSAGAAQSKTDRYCLGSWIDCSPAPHSTETTAHLNWQGNPVESLTARLGFSTSKRDVKAYNADAFLAEVPLANQVPATAAAAGVTLSAYAAMQALGLGAYGLASGVVSVPTASLTTLQKLSAFYYGSTVIGANTFLLNNPVLGALMGSRNARISELAGLQSYNLTNKDGNKAKASLGWQATETIALTTDLEYAQDKYKTAVYGLQSAKTTNWNLDATWTPTDQTSLSVFYSYEDQKQNFAGNTFNNNSAAANVNTGGTDIVGSPCYTKISDRNANFKTDSCSNWYANNRDRTDTLGAALTKNGLIGGKLDLRAGLSFSAGRTDINVRGGTYVNNPWAGLATSPYGNIGNVGAYYFAASALPTVKVSTIDFQLAGTVHLGKESGIRATYGYKRISVTDWAYDGMAAGGLVAVLPTNEKAPHFGVSTMGLAYTTSFR